MSSVKDDKMMDVQVPVSHYLDEKYISLERYISYFYQIDGIRNCKPQSVLIIGVGDDVVPTFLRKANYTVTTIDIDSELQPDVVADVRNMPFDDGSYDVVCAFQVLEHLPYEEFEGILKELHRVSKKNVIISVPHRRTGFEMIIKFPYIRSLLHKDFVRFALRFPVKFKGFESSGQHYWEIDWFTTKLKKVRTDMEKYFTITAETTPVLDPYRRFFVLKKNTV
ncbi:MAG: Methyltransferase type 11 [Parcubacteria group bacterium GW2011_GWA2_43_11]|nr:MAG: Methyltransferase type 11 [Parcubacteria group bacterium GW2011_GWA2_43_11]